MNVYELSGWVGAILVLIAYFLVSTEKMNSKSFTFQALNIAGAFLLVLYTYNCKAYASMSVNLIWIFIGVVSASKIPRVRKTHEAQSH